MKIEFNKSQKEKLADFFTNLSVAWFGALFLTPGITSDLNFLTLFLYAANMGGALYIALFLLREQKI